MENLQNKNLAELFDLGIELNLQEKKQLIKDVSEFSAELAQELEKMFASNPSQMGLSRAINKLKYSDNDVNALEMPKQIGKFKILSILGFGGMGMVFLGKREDINQLVAVKVAHSSKPDSTKTQAITSEAKILASLQHPNISSLVDWGEYQNGHYIATEFVDGATIDHYCEEHKFTVKQRIDLLIKIIDAVEFAHNNLIIHRDIKPSNIMVDEAGEPILIDFGVARLMESENAEHQQTVDAALTPSYASPEQRQGKPLSVRSDIYSLAAVLLNLVTGKQIDKQKEQSLLPIIEKIIVKDQQQNKSKWHKISKPMRKDLSLILAKSLSYDPKQRYANAFSFKKDLQALLTIKPIIAHEPSQWYWFKKFVARNKLVTGVLTLAFMATLFGGWQWYRAVEQRDLAIESNNELVNYSVFLRTVLKGINTNSGGSANATVTDFLNQAIEAYKNEKDMSDYQLAWFGNLLGGVFEGRGNFTKALKLYKLGLNHAEISPEPLDDIGLLISIAILHGSNLRFDLGLKSAKKALYLIEKNPETSWKKAIANIALSFSYLEAGQLAQAILTFDKVINDSKSHIAYVANALLYKADAQNRLYLLEDGIKNIHKALGTFISRYGEESAYVTGSNSLLYLMKVKINPNNYSLSEQNKLKKIHIKIFKNNDPEQALLLIKFAEVFFLKNDFVRAIEHLKQAENIFKNIKTLLPIHLNILYIKLAKYQMLNNEIQAAIKTINTVDKTILNKLANHELVKYQLLITCIKIANSDLLNAKNLLIRASDNVKKSEYKDIIAEFYFRTAQLASLEKDYQACFNNAQKATEMADKLYPKTWQLPNAYRFLQDVCQQKINGSDNHEFPYLQAVLDSPWKQETVITTKVLNQE